MSKNDMFLGFVKGLMIVMLLYGAGMFAVVIWGDSDSIATKMLVAFSAMFSGVLGLGSGYLLGKSNGENGATSTSHK
jgi:hypothetical protein